ncbi:MULTISPECIES: DUF3617 domain-containing protein [Sphingobium]|uniref:DUF3617 domain-containing protein n=2 Tax=Sphingobium cupriresistens TaxID=1132417 RepID=A0A0J7XSB8_9SPHN|nr:MULTISPECIES: DUF3617 domain-containing protein [Sphingobium]KMS53943.1 hypothetical protein V473_17180 [Sphingobium cupriresistens LL01]MBJ7378106.1 DUF3617 domain-containing protein [Sphingobium sp.]RYM14618.1 DUF3617 domain-containing protein [Sphingobium cupriresistens]WCP13414.1 hypothetical protein sphantq_01842 [Sphingobium sp. AntQ-1]
MRRTVLTLAVLTIGLAACSEKPGDKTGDIAATDAMSKQEVKAQVDKVQLKPGQWEGRFTVKDLDLGDMPGAPANMKEQMKSAMNQTALKYCVTPEQAANPSGEMFAGQENKNCTYGGFEAKGGAVQGQVSCKSEGGTMNATMSGTYAPENYAMDMDMKMVGGPQGMTMAMTARSEGKWIGPACVADK